MHRAAWKAGVMGALNLLAVVLAIRLVLLVAVVGALWLAKLALDVPQPVQQAALIMLGGLLRHRRPADGLAVQPQVARAGSPSKPVS